MKIFIEWLKNPKVIEWFKDAVTWIVKNFKDEILMVAVDFLQKQYHKMFKNRNILILGPKSSGKSSLILYMASGKPFEMVGKERKTPEPTALSAVVDRKFHLQTNEWVKIKKDVPGDLSLRETWRQAIIDIDPEGIIYLIDGRVAEKESEKLVRDIFESVLIHYSESSRMLISFHIFINFGDKWASSPEAERKLVRVIENEFEKQRSQFESINRCRFGVSMTQLSPNKDSWTEVHRAINRFGADLIE